MTLSSYPGTGPPNPSTAPVAGGLVSIRAGKRSDWEMEVLPSVPPMDKRA